jgi:hypothetical protein
MAGLTPPDAGRAIFRRRRQRPILPLMASSVGTDQLLGGPGSRPAAVDALAARTLVKGEPLVPPAGRADDFVWPQREIGQEQVKGETPVSQHGDGRCQHREKQSTMMRSVKPSKPGEAAMSNGSPGDCSDDAKANP